MPERVVQTRAFLANNQRDTARYRLTALALDDSTTPARRRFVQWLEPAFRVVELGVLAVDGADFTRHVVGPGEIGRMDLIAFKHYQDVNLWWAIATVNNIGNQFLEMYPGQQLLIPSRDDVIGTMTPES